MTFKLDAVRAALHNVGVTDMRIAELASGATTDFLPRLLLTVEVPDDVEGTVASILRSAQ